MQQKETTIISRADGLSLSVLTTCPVGEARGTVQLLHGMAEHKERYLPLMEYLTENGFLCVIHDHRGHGKSVKSEADLGFFGKNGGAMLLADCIQVGDHIEEQYPDLPHFLIGHSMGSLAARAYLKTRDGHFNGAVIIGSPSNNPARAAGEFLLSSAELLRGGHHRSAFFDNLLMGAFEKAFPAEGKSAWLSTDPASVANYREDPLCGFSFTVNGYRGLLWLMKETYGKKGWRMENPDLPVKFLSGGADPCRTNDKMFDEAVEFLRSRGYRNVTSHLYPGMRHEIHGERGKEQVWADILSALESI